jgi:hypothetical protein
MTALLTTRLTDMDPEEERLAHDWLLATDRVQQAQLDLLEAERAQERARQAIAAYERARVEVGA